MGRTLEIRWQETASELKEQYRKEQNPERRTRLHAFWQLRLGKAMKDVAEIVGMTYRTLQNWVAWYRLGGMNEVLQRIKGHGNQGRSANLTPIRQKALVAKVALGDFRNVWDAVQWVRDRWKVQYSYSGLFKRLKSLKCRLKVPRPRSVKADVEAQNEWKDIGLTEALRETEITLSHRAWFSDEMRFGLWGQTRKRWGVRGIKIIQPIQIEFAWQYLVLAVDVMRCKVYWAWADRMNQDNLIPIFKKWMPDAMIWDGASVHRSKAMGEVGFERIFLPPYSPELNPCERIFEWLRAKIEGKVYASLAHKRYEINQHLRHLSHNKYELEQLIDWEWIQNAIMCLSS